MATKMNAVNWFEVPVSDIDRAKKFYEHVCKTTLSLNEMGPLKMAWFPMNETAVGATGTLVKGPGYTPSHQGSLVYFAVEDVEAGLKRVTEKGGKILTPKTSIGKFGFIGHFEDCEGNKIALHSDK
jgi:uncharacterized protein